METRVVILESKELQDLRGDHGETFCVFLKDSKNPLNSCWSWKHTREEAQRLKEKLEAFQKSRTEKEIRL